MCENSDHVIFHNSSNLLNGFFDFFPKCRFVNDALQNF